MNRRNTKITMSLVLASMLSMGMTGCGGSDDAATPGAASSAVDVTVERGKVYDANVTDSSTPAQVATQKSGKNVYTFAKAPKYPVVVNGGWIDVNDDGVMDVNDTKLDIEMKSYTTTVTPITTVIADANETIREQKLEKLLEGLNTAGVGAEANVTAADLLKVPSEAPRDVMVMANAIFKDMKENNITTVDTNGALDMGQFNGIYAAIDTTLTDEEISVAVEKEVFNALGDKVEKVSNQDVFKFEQEQPGALVPALAQALLKNNIIGLGMFDGHKFNADYTLEGGATWRVEGKELIIDPNEGDFYAFTFTNETPVDNETISSSVFWIDENGVKQSVSDPVNSQIIVTPSVIVTPPSTGGTTLPDLNGYSSIVIYKNIAQTTADGFLAAYSNNSGFQSKNTSASCTDFGFTVTPSEVSAGGTTIKTYTEINGTTIRSCIENDYTNAQFGGGSANILAYYGK